MRGGGPEGADGPVSLGLQLTNRLDSSCGADVVVRMRNATGPMGEGEGGFGSWDVCAGGGGGGGGGALGDTVPGWGTVNFTCTVDPTAVQAGWVIVQAVLNGTVEGTGCDRPYTNKTLVVYEVGVAVVLPQPPLPDPLPLRPLTSNVFGGQMISSPVAAARIGMLSARSGPLWRWAQPFEWCVGRWGEASARAAEIQWEAGGTKRTHLFVSHAPPPFPPYVACVQLEPHLLPPLVGL